MRFHSGWVSADAGKCTSRQNAPMPHGNPDGRFGTLLAFDLARLDIRDVIRIAAVACIVTAIPLAAGNPTAAIPLSIGAVFSGVSEAGLPFGYRWRTMLWTTLWLMVGVFLGSAVSNTIWLAIALSLPVAFIAGAAGFRGPRAAVAGLLALVVFTIYAGTPVPLDDAFTSAALMGLGGFSQFIASVIACVLLGRHRIPHIREIGPAFSKLFTDDRTFLTHAIRLAIVITIATAISELLSMPHQYWLPMTVAWMSKPDRHGTVNRVIHRIAGTLIGVVLIGGIDFLVAPGMWGFYTLSMIGAAIAVAFIWVNYATAVIGVTMWVIGLFALLSDPVAETLVLRIVLTVAAGVMVLIAAAVHLPGSRATVR